MGQASFGGSIKRILLSYIFQDTAFKLVKDQDLVPLAIDLLLLMLEDKKEETIRVADAILKRKQLYKILCVKHQIYLELNKLDEAIEMLNQGLKLKPTSKKINLLMGRMLQRIDKLDEALIYLKKSIEFKPDCDILYEIGLLHQTKGQHQLAIESFTQACDIRAKNKYYIAKMNSFKSMNRYDEALECCQIAILAKPQKSLYYCYKKELIELQRTSIGSEEHVEELGQNDSFYSLENFEEKRRVQDQRVLLQKRQSQLKFQQSRSSIITKKLQTAIVQYEDAIYYSFTYFFVSFTNQDLSDFQKKIGSYLSQKQYIYLENLEELIFYSLNALFPSIQKMERKQVITNLAQWEKKLDFLEQGDIYQSLFNLFQSLVLDESVKGLISDRISEDFSKKLEREKKHQNLLLLLGCIGKELQNAESNIFDSAAGQLGLEHGLQLLGFLILFPELSVDQEDINTIVWRLFSQKDLIQLYQSQSSIKLKGQQQCLKEEELLLENNPSMIQFAKYLSQVKKK